MGAMLRRSQVQIRGAAQERAGLTARPLSISYLRTERFAASAARRRGSAMGLFCFGILSWASSLLQGYGLAARSDLGLTLTP